MYRKYAGRLVGEEGKSPLISLSTFPASMFYDKHTSFLSLKKKKRQK